MLYGAVAVLVFDGIASFISLRQGVPYGDFSVGSFIIYAIAGFVAAKVAGWTGAVKTGAALGLIDATMGWGLAWLIGPGKLPPDATFTAWMWPVIALTATVSAVVLALIGAAVARVVGGMPGNPGVKEGTTPRE